MKTLLLLLVLIELPQWARTQNIGSNCLWACVNVLGRMHQINEVDQVLLDRLVVDKLVGFKWATDENVIAYLDSIGANYKHTKYSTKKDFSLLEKYGESYGVVVSLHAGFRRGWSDHAVLVISFTDTHVIFWDPNFPKWTYKAKRNWFDQWWTGSSLVVLPKGE